LADDLLRFREGRPIVARPVGRWERCWRWARRNPRVAGLLSALVLVFLVGFLGILWQWRKAESLKLVAQQQRDEARRSLRPRRLRRPGRRRLPHSRSSSRLQSLWSVRAHGSCINGRRWIRQGPRKLPHRRRRSQPAHRPRFLRRLRPHPRQLQRRNPNPGRSRSPRSV